MSLEIQSFKTIDSIKKEEVVNLLAAYTNGELDELPQMLPVMPEDIYEKHSGFVAIQDNEFAGYIGSTEPEEWDCLLMSEVGSLWVPSQYRKHGIAHKLVKTISKELVLEGLQPYAFCNPLSEPIFREIGYEDAKITGIPSSAFSLCSSCPKQPIKGCCDKVLIYNGEKS